MGRISDYLQARHIKKGLRKNPVLIGVAEKHYIKWTAQRQENVWKFMKAIQ